MKMNNHHTKFKLFVLFTLCCGYIYAQQPRPRFSDVPIELQSIWTESILINGSFEDGFEGWALTMGAMHPGDVIKSNIQFDDSTSHNGFNSLKLTGDENTTYWHALVSHPIPIKGGSRYRLRGWIKTDDVRQEGDQYLNSNLYVQFFDDQGQVVKISNSRVRSTKKILGSQDWKMVDRNVRAPIGSVEARVGCVLTCSGTAWFDELDFSASRSIAWKKKFTDRFEYFYQKDTPPDTILAMNDAYTTAMEAILKLKYPEKIKYYKYNSNIHKLEITSIMADSHHEGDIIHAITWDQKHDIVHVLMNQVGRSTPLLEEGIVYYSLSVVLNMKIHKGAVGMHLTDSLLPLKKLIDPAIFNKTPVKMAEAHAGSFVSFLVEQYGIDTFKKLYPFKSTANIVEELPQRFLTLYGMNLDEAEMAWTEYLSEMIKLPDVDKNKPLYKKKTD